MSVPRTRTRLETQLEFADSGLGRLPALEGGKTGRTLEEMTMRAEAQKFADTIKEAIVLLRRSL